MLQDLETRVVVHRYAEMPLASGRCAEASPGYYIRPRPATWAIGTDALSGPALDFCGVFGLHLSGLTQFSTGYRFRRFCRCRLSLDRESLP